MQSLSKANRGFVEQIRWAWCCVLSITQQFLLVLRIPKCLGYLFDSKLPIPHVYTNCYCVIDRGQLDLVWSYPLNSLVYFQEIRFLVYLVRSSCLASHYVQKILMFASVCVKFSFLVVLCKKMVTVEKWGMWSWFGPCILMVVFRPTISLWYSLWVTPVDGTHQSKIPIKAFVLD